MSVGQNDDRVLTVETSRRISLGRTPFIWENCHSEAIVDKYTGFSLVFVLEGLPLKVSVRSKSPLLAS